jgi:Tol biopolymer transport system component
VSRNAANMLIVLLLITALTVAIKSRATADEGIFVMSTDGGGERKVISVERAGAHRSPRWSHDGKRLAFDVIVERRVRMSYVVNLDGTELKEVGELESPDWSPNDKLLALDSDELDAIFVQNVDGSERTRLCDGTWPRWSPDGKRIAFCDGTSLKVFDLEQRTESRICAGKFAQRPASFDWSRDGKRVALFTRTVGNGPRELYILNADGSSNDLKPRYRQPGMVGGHVTWSPGDKQLIFTVDSIIHVLDVEGTGDPRLVPNQSDSNRDPAISPNGKLIAFARRPLPVGLPPN